MGRIYRVVAIDGPAASGKSSVARDLAGRLGFAYVNSGAIYRALTWHVLQKGVDGEDAERIAETVEAARISCRLENNESHILINDVDPVAHLRDNDVNEKVPWVSRIPRLRRIAVKEMRRYAQHHDLVVEGRDIGSVVFPETRYKFYLDASPEVRLRRRAAEGQRDEIVMRDRADSSRPISPLIIAKDAQLIDTSHLTIEGVVNEIIARLKQMDLLI